MQKLIFSLTLFLLTLVGQTQILDGIYFALELNGLRVDTSGKVGFYMSDHYPKEKWFHEVKVIIKNNSITVDKCPVSYDSLGKKGYSASDGGFLTYKGAITKVGDLFIAKTRLVDYDYIGFSVFEPPLIADDLDSSYIDTALLGSKKPSLKERINELRKTHDVTKGFHGNEVFLPKGTLRQDFVIRPDKGGLWINNVFYYRRRK
jgi:hypothetical protein